MSAREEILARIRRATPGSPPAAAVPREYATSGGPTGAALLDLLVERVEDYKATVHRCTPDTLAVTVAAALGDARRVVVPDGLDDDVLGAFDGEVLQDSPQAPLDVPTLDDVDAVVTACTVAVAVTGTFVLDGSAACGRRAVTLVPDHHVVVLHADQVVASVPEALSRLDPRRPLTWVSGPSATSDIELSRVEGVHGPRRLDVCLVIASGT